METVLKSGWCPQTPPPTIGSGVLPPHRGHTGNVFGTRLLASDLCMLGLGQEWGLWGRKPGAWQQRSGREVGCVRPLAPHTGPEGPRCMILVTRGDCRMTKWRRYGVGLQCTGACDWLEVTVSTSLCPSFLNSPLETSGQTKPDPTDLKKGLGQRQVTRIKQGTAFSKKKKKNLHI